MNETEKSLGELFQAAVRNDRRFAEAVKIARKNHPSSIWLIGGFLYRTLAIELHGSPALAPEVDFDFLVDAPTASLFVPQACQGWEIVRNEYGNPKYRQGSFQIDFVPLPSVAHIIRRKVDPTIRNFLTGTPLTIQSLAYDVLGGQITGPIGIKALFGGKIEVNDPASAAFYSLKKKKPISQIIQEKAEELNFTPVHPAE